MKTADGRWSAHVWFWGFIFIFLTHAFAVFWLAESETFSSQPSKPAAYLYLAGSADTDEYLARHAALRDPTLFALPHLNGFSGGAWLNFQPQAPPLSNWTAAPEWLSLPAADLGRTLDDHMTTNRPSEASLLASLRATRAPEVRIPDRPLLTNSTFRILGPLTRRKLAFAPALPSVVTNDVLASTVVALSVDHNGIVESASVVHRESESELADSHALQLARSFLFEPLARPESTNQSPTTFGQLVFTWNTLAPTNALAPASAGAP